MAPFGLLNLGAAYNEVAESIRTEVNDESFWSYVDDSMANTRTLKEDMEVLKKVFVAIRNHGQLLNPSKVQLFKTEVDFMGQEGVRPRDDDLRRIREWPKPTTGKQLASFLGVLTWYSTFMTEFSQLAARLNQWKTKKLVAWDSDLEKDFRGLQGAFCRSAGRRHLYLDPKTKIYPDLVLQIDFSSTV